MGMQQTYGGVARIIAPLFFGWCFDTLGVSSPYFFSSTFIFATLLLGFGLDRYAKGEVAARKSLRDQEENKVASDQTTKTRARTRGVNVVKGHS